MLNPSILSFLDQWVYNIKYNCERPSHSINITLNAQEWLLVVTYPSIYVQLALSWKTTMVS